jgi:hypothetical protein
MKKIYIFGAIFVFLLVVQQTIGQGLENFNNYPETQNAYHNGSFTGQDGSTWQYFQCRGDSAIVAPTPTLGKNRTPTAEIISGTILNGCGTLSFDYKQPFTTNVNLDVFVNGLQVYTATTSSEQGILKNTGPIAVNVVGNVVFDFKQHDVSAGQVEIDNITWTSNSTVLPEPTSYPSNFVNNVCSYDLSLNWADATGGQLPTAYLIKASTQNNITLPVDGTPVPDDVNLADGSGAINIVQGIQTCTFTNIPANNHYYFAIFPYTNTGSAIDFKTDGTVPATDVFVGNITTLNAEDFNDRTFGNWTTTSIVGSEVWAIDTIHGVAGTPCAKMSGYNGSNLDNEDWLISPALNFDSNVVKLTFMSAKNYVGPDLEVKVSNTYTGTGNPNSATWTDLTPNLSPGSWTWTSSGCIDLSGIAGSSVYLAFKYTSTTAGASTWEIDDVLVTKETMTGIEPVTVNPNELKVFPNPTSGMTTLSFNANGMKEIIITSVLGNRVFQATTLNSLETLQLNNLSKGIYFIQVKFDETSKSITKKLIIQ